MTEKPKAADGVPKPDPEDREPLWRGAELIRRLRELPSEELNRFLANQAHKRGRLDADGKPAEKF